MVESGKAKSSSRVMPCPKCRRSVRYDLANPYRPFCSALCKDEDIIAWAEGSYTIPTVEADDDESPQDESADES